MTISPHDTMQLDSTPRVRRTQLQRRSEAELRLLDAARSIVARKGWAGMTLAEVGETAGYSRGLAAHHFGSKPKLLQALAMHIGQGFLSTFSERRKTGLEAILELISAYLGRSHDQWTNTRALLILMAEGTTDDSEAGENLASYNQRSFDYLRRLIDEGVKAGELRADIDGASAAIVLLGSLRGIMLQSLQKNSVVDLAAVRRETLSIFIRATARQPKRYLEAWLAPRA